jgi:glycosyltransferase involved in cell wall biosynthesis
MLLSKLARQILRDKPVDSIDLDPWEHPYLSSNNISQFRHYSEQLWQFAGEYAANHSEPLRAAFSVNMAQNMYKWAKLSHKFGWETALFLHPQDSFVINDPRWEEFDGEVDDLLNVDLVKAGLEQLSTAVSIVAPKNINPDVYTRLRREGGVFFQLLDRFRFKGMQLEVFDKYPSFRSYFSWARELTSFDVIHTASSPFAAYASGRPYCLFSVGGDLQYDCGRGDEFGRATLDAFQNGRFLTISNPHTLGHSRRLGLTNGVYLPYPMDTKTYTPGQGWTREKWRQQYGGEVFILTTARLDEGVKGQSKEFIKTLVNVARKNPNTRFIFISWGANADSLKRKIAEENLDEQFILIPPAGKKRLIDYYRSCDLVLDQFVYGYYGATMLEAASIGKPVIMFLRSEQYRALYRGDVAPVYNASSVVEVEDALNSLINDQALRAEMGSALRDWIDRTHGEERTTPLLLALLRLAAKNVPLPKDLKNPLTAPLQEEEVAYHNSCLQKV